MAARSDICVHRTSYGIVCYPPTAHKQSRKTNYKKLQAVEQVHQLDTFSQIFDVPQKLEIKRPDGINIDPLDIICINFFSISQSRLEHHISHVFQFLSNFEHVIAEREFTESKKHGIFDVQDVIVEWKRGLYKLCPGGQC